MTHPRREDAAGPRGRGQALDAVEREIAVLLRRVRRVITQRAAAVHPDLGSLGYLALAQLTAAGPQRISELAHALAVDKAAMTRQVQQLESLGLISRTPDPADGRASLIAATGEAGAAMQRVVQARRATYEDTLQEWTTAEIVDLGALLARYNDSLESRAGGRA